MAMLPLAGCTPEEIAKEEIIVELQSIGQAKSSDCSIQVQGAVKAYVGALGYERLRQPMDALPKRVTDLGVIALEREVTIEGKILDDEDQGLAASFRLGVIDPLDRSLYWFRGEAFKSSQHSPSSDTANDDWLRALTRKSPFQASVHTGHRQFH